MEIRGHNLLFAITVFGCIAFGFPESRKPVDITVISAVDEQGQENRRTGKKNAHARVGYGDGFEKNFDDDFNKNFDHDFTKGFNHDFTNFNHDFAKDFNHDFGKDFNDDFAKNFDDDINKKFGNHLTKSLDRDSDHISVSGTETYSDKSIGDGLQNVVDQNLAGDNSKFAGNPNFVQQTNKIALQAANRLSNKNGFPFVYKPPGPDYAYATGAINPHETYVKTEINEPNHGFGFIHNRFQDDDDDDSTSAKEKEGSEQPTKLEPNTTSGDGSAQQKPKTKRPRPIKLPQMTVLSNKKVVTSSLDNRFAGADEDDNPNKKVKTIVHSSADGKPLYRTTVTTKKGSEASLDNRFASEDDDQPKYDSVQSFVTTDNEGKKLYETEVYISKAEPSLASRFQEDEPNDKDHYFHTFVTGLDADNVVDANDSSRAEIITGKNGIVKRIVSKQY